MGTGLMPGPDESTRGQIRAAGGRLVSAATTAASRMTSFTMSLIHGWRGPDGRRVSPAPGDIVLLAVLSPRDGVTGPSGWTEIPGGQCPAWWRMIGPREIDPVFYSAEPSAWMVHGWIVTPETPEAPEALP